MTTEQQIEAGPETDRLVAEALGMVGVGCSCGPGPGGSYDPETGVCRRVGCGRKLAPRFSTDWNDAMLAAERFGLCTYRESGSGLKVGRVLLQDGDEWCVWELQGGDGSAEATCTGPSAPTGPLAICRAILWS